MLLHLGAEGIDSGLRILYEQGTGRWEKLRMVLDVMVQCSAYELKPRDGMLSRSFELESSLNPSAVRVELLKSVDGDHYCLSLEVWMDLQVEHCDVPARIQQYPLPPDIYPLETVIKGGGLKCHEAVNERMG